MNRFEWTASRPARVTLGALALSVLLFVWTLAHALRLRTGAGTSGATVCIDSRTRRAGTGCCDGHRWRRAGRDLFAADRTGAPSRRYRIPGRRKR